MRTLTEIDAAPGVWANRSVPTPTRPPKTEYGGANAFVTAAIVAAIVGLQRADLLSRDIAVVGIALTTTVFAFVYLRAVWLYVLATVPVFHLVVGLFGEPKFSAVRLLLMVLLGPVVANAKVRKAVIEGLKSQPGITFGLFVLSNFAAAIVAGEAEAVFRSSTYFEPFAIFLITYALVRSKDCELEHVIKAIIIGGWLVAGFAFVEILTQQAITETLKMPGLPGEVPAVYLTDNRFGLGGRIMSTIGQPVYAGMYFGLWIFCCGLLAVTQKRASKWLWLGSAAVGAVLLLETGSRGPILAFIVAMPLLGLNREHRRRTLALVATVVIGLVLVAFLSPELLFDYFSATFSLDPNRAEAANLLGRFDLTSTLLNVFRENPIFGFGPGLIQKAAFRGDADFLSLAGLENQYAVILADAGILAGASYLAFMVTTIVRIVQSKARVLVEWHNQAASFILTMFVFYFLCVAGATCLTLVPNYLLMAVYGGFLAQERRLASEFAK